MKQTLKQTALFIGASALCAGQLCAQDITPLIASGDPVSWGANVVNRVGRVDINNSAEWVVHVDADEAPANWQSDEAIVKNGTVLFQEGTSVGFPASHASDQFGYFIQVLDINDNGDVLVLTTLIDSTGVLPDRRAVLWHSEATGNSHVLLEEGVTLSDSMTGEPSSFLQQPGSVWTSITTVWQNNLNQLVVRGRTDSHATNILVKMEHDGLGNITSQQMIAVDGAKQDLEFPPSDGMHVQPVADFSYTRESLAINDSGQVLFRVDDERVLPGEEDVNTHYYIDTTEVLWEADLSPTGSGLPFADLTGLEVDLNDGGNFIAVMREDDPTVTSGYFINKNGAVFIRQGDPVPTLDPMSGFTLGNNFGDLQMSNGGDVTWLAIWEDANSPDTNAALFQNFNMLVRKGTTLVGAEKVTWFGSSEQSMRVSDSGLHVILELRLEDGSEGAYLIGTGDRYASMCFGDGGDQLGCTPCPCFNQVPAGSTGGCLNSQGVGATLRGIGLSSTSLPAGSVDDLRFSLEGGPPNSLAVLLSANGATPLFSGNPCFGANSGILSLEYDGLRCIADGVLRHGNRMIDVNGEIGAINSPWGGEGAPLSGIAGPRSGFFPGQTRYFQAVYRDDPMAICMRGQNTSQAVEVTFTP